MKKNGEITEDDLKQGEDKIQKLTDKFCKEVGQIVTGEEIQGDHGNLTMQPALRSSELRGGTSYCCYKGWRKPP